MVQDPVRRQSYRQRRALVLHPRTPAAVALEQVRRLYWKELLEVSVSPRLDPRLRRLADRCLAERLGGLTLGERINLARRVGRGLIDVLCNSDEGPVLQALLANPRLSPSRSSANNRLR